MSLMPRTPFGRRVCCILFFYSHSLPTPLVPVLGSFGFLVVMATHAQVALPMVEVAIQLMKVMPDDEELDNMSMAIKRVRRWAVLEKGGSSNTMFQKE